VLLLLRLRSLLQRSCRQRRGERSSQPRAASCSDCEPSHCGWRCQ